MAYLAYAMAVSWMLRHRIKQQVLAEALFELAAYIDIKADFYDTRYNLTEQFNKLVRHQSLLADRQQASRDLILRSHQNSRDAIVLTESLVRGLAALLTTPFLVPTMLVIGCWLKASGRPPVHRRMVIASV